MNEDLAAQNPALYNKKKIEKQPEIHNTHHKKDTQYGCNYNFGLSDSINFKWLWTPPVKPLIIEHK